MNLYSIFRDATILGAVFLGMAILNHAWSANSTVFPTTAGYITMALVSLIVAVIAGFHCQVREGQPVSIGAQQDYEDPELDRLAVAVGVLEGSNYRSWEASAAA